MNVKLTTHLYCGGFNENGPQSFICLNGWFPVDGTLWEGLRGLAGGGMDLLEEVCH